MGAAKPKAGYRPDRAGSDCSPFAHKGTPKHHPPPKDAARPRHSAGTPVRFRLSLPNWTIIHSGVTLRCDTQHHKSSPSRCLFWIVHTRVRLPPPPPETLPKQSKEGQKHLRNQGFWPFLRPRRSHSVHCNPTVTDGKLGGNPPTVRSSYRHASH